MSDPRPFTVPPYQGSTRPATPDRARVLVVFVTLVTTLYFGRAVLIPVVLALLLAFVIAPLVGLLRRAHLGRVPSVLLGVVLALGMLLALGGILVTQLGQFTTELPRYIATVETKIDAVKTFTVGRVSQLAHRIDPRLAEATPSLPHSTAPDLSGSPAVQRPEAVLLEFIHQYLSPVLSQLASFAIVFTVSVFALLQGEDLRDRVVRLSGLADLQRTTLILNDETQHLRHYFFTQLSVNASYGVVIGTGLFFIGLPNPVLWGTLSALLRFIPYIGSVLAAGLAMAVAAAVGPEWSIVLWTTGFYIVVEGLTGQVIEPLIYGRSTGLSPFSIVVAAIFWSWLWGPAGLLLSTPLTMCLVVLGRHVEQLRFLDVMLGDEPALTPAQGFYQRVLSGDAAELRAGAKVFLKHGSLARYYDEVAIRGLLLATIDAGTGMLEAAQLEKIRMLAENLVRDLNSHVGGQLAADQLGCGAAAHSRLGEGRRQKHPMLGYLSSRVEGPDVTRGPSTVLCIPGGGPFDAAASAMLIQLIQRHGMIGRLASHNDDMHGIVKMAAGIAVTIVCIVCLDVSGHVAVLRQLAYQLRQGMPPHMLVLIGMWPVEDPALPDAVLRAEIGADCDTRSLEQAVEACARAALHAGPVPAQR